MSVEDQLAGAGNVVGVKIGSRVWQLFVSPTDDALAILQVFGIHSHEGIGVNEDVEPPLNNAFFLRPIAPNYGIEAEHARQSLIPAGADLNTPPQLEIVDLLNPNYEVPSTNWLYKRGVPI